MNLSQIARALARRPGYLLTSVALLALGAGAATGIYRIVDAVLVHPLAAPEPERLVRIFPTDEQHSGPQGSSAYPVFTDYRDGARLLTDVAASSDWESVHLARGAGEPERIAAGLATGNFFALFGARPAVGRLLGPADDRAGAPPVAVLSWESFMRRFAGERSIVGSTVRLNGQPVDVVGVLARGFRGPTLNGFPEVWLPMTAIGLVNPEMGQWKPLEQRGWSFLDLTARLAPGATMAAAQAELDAIDAARAKTESREERDPWPLLVPAERALVADDPRVARVAWLLAATSGLVLLVAAANAAGLALARMLERQRELAIRGALGASRRALVGSVVAESALVAVFAALAAVPVSSAVVGLFARYAPGLPIPLEPAGMLSGGRVAAGAAILAAIASLVFALGPAATAARVDALAALRASGAGAEAAGGRGPRLRRLLVAGQAALAMLLLVGAGLFGRTLVALHATPLGFRPGGVATAMVDLARQGYRDDEARRVAREIRDRLAATPGVLSAGYGFQVPTESGGMRRTMTPEGFTWPEGADEAVNFNSASPGYFATLGIPLVAGRDFADGDRQGAPRVAIVNRAFAERFFPGREAVGRTIHDSGRDPWQVTIVGVVENYRERGLRDDPEPLLYVAAAQESRPRVQFLARVEPGAESRAIAAIRAAAHAVDPALPVFRARSFGDQIAAALAPERTFAALVGAAAAIALALTASGLAGLVAFVVRRRTREFGIRAALGAERRRILRLVLGEALALTAAGLAAGALAAAWGAHLVASFLYGVRALDPLAWLAAAALLLAATTAAVLPIAWRAAEVEPAAALRAE